MADEINCESNMRFQILINKFPEEMLLKIFSFLDVKSLKNMTLINKRWYITIINDTSIMKRLPLTFRGDVLRNNHLILGELGAKLNKVLFKSMAVSYSLEMLSKLEAIGSNVHEIEFKNCRVSDPIVFQNILRNFPKVEKLKFKRCKFRNDYQKSNTEALKLNNLKDLLMLDSCLTILSTFEAQLLTLNVDKLSFNEAPEEAERNIHLMNFLCRQKRLFTLKIRNNHSLSQIKNAGYQFKLINLSINSGFYKEGIDDENLREFLNTQKDSVKVLQLNSSFEDDIHELVLNKFVHLITLRFDITDLPPNLKRFKPIKNVKTLFLDGVNENVAEYSAFLSLFPNTTVISFQDEVIFNVLSCLPKCCSALTSISMYGLSCESYENVIFPALKSLHLDAFVFGDGWSEMVMCNLTIETLSFKFYTKSNNFDANEIKTVCEVLPNLKHLKLAKEMRNKLHYFDNIKKSIKITI